MPLIRPQSDFDRNRDYHQLLELRKISYDEPSIQSKPQCLCPMTTLSLPSARACEKMAGELTGAMVCEEEQVPLYREIPEVELPAHC